MQGRHQLFTFLFFALPLIFLPFSKALTSISVALLIVYSVYCLFKNESWLRLDIIAIIFIAYMGLSLISVLYSNNQAEAWQKILLKLPLLFIPSFILLKKQQQIKWYLGFEMIYVSMSTIIAMLSVINYYMQKEALDFMVLQNKPIPVIADIYHIEYSVLLALSILICVYRLVFYYWRPGFWQYIYLAGLVIGVYAIHIMSVRTGLLTLYSGLMALGIAYVYKYRRFKLVIYSVLAGVFFLGLSYQFSESFRNRIKLTKQDVGVLFEQKDRNWHSVSMRVEAFTTGLQLLKKHFFIGVGIGDVGEEVQKQYVINNSKLELVNRKKPHHQFLENALQSGVLSPVLLLLILVLPLFIKRYRNPLLVATMVALIAAMQFESILERQSTVIVFCLLYAHLLSLNAVSILPIEPYKKE